MTSVVRSGSETTAGVTVVSILAPPKVVNAVLMALSFSVPRCVSMSMSSTEIWIAAISVWRALMAVSSNVLFFAIRPFAPVSLALLRPASPTWGLLKYSGPLT
jgi:hypothetical protein